MVQLPCEGGGFVLVHLTVFFVENTVCKMMQKTQVQVYVTISHKAIFASQHQTQCHQLFDKNNVDERPVTDLLQFAETNQKQRPHETAARIH